MTSIALPLSTNAITPSQRATRWVGHDLPLVEPCWVSQITHSSLMCPSTSSSRVSSMIFPGCPCLTPILYHANPVGSWPTQTPLFGCIFGWRGVGFGSGPFLCVFFTQVGRVSWGTAAAAPPPPPQSCQLKVSILAFLWMNFIQVFGFPIPEVLSGWAVRANENSSFFFLGRRVGTFAMKKLRCVAVHFTFPSLPSGSLERIGWGRDNPPNPFPRPRGRSGLQIGKSTFLFRVVQPQQCSRDPPPLLVFHAGLCKSMSKALNLVIDPFWWEPVPLPTSICFPSPRAGNLTQPGPRVHLPPGSGFEHPLLPADR